MKYEAPERDHYETTKQVFQHSAVHKQGYYDARPGGDFRHSVWQLRVRRIVLSILDVLLHTPPEMTKVIDIGCGRGDFTIELARRYPHLKEVWGTDFCQEALAIARVDGKPLNNLFFKEADILELPFEDNRFDGTLCINTLHHIHHSDLEKAIGELARITRRYLILEIKNKRNLYYRSIHYRAVHGVGNIRVFPTSAGVVSQMLRRHGFQLTRERGIFLWSWLSPLVILVFEKAR